MNWPTLLGKPSIFADHLEAKFLPNNGLDKSLSWYNFFRYPQRRDETDNNFNAKSLPDLIDSQEKFPCLGAITYCKQWLNLAKLRSECMKNCRGHHDIKKCMQNGNVLANLTITQMSKLFEI